jgi:hypothetical protein
MVRQNESGSDERETVLCWRANTSFDGSFRGFERARPVRKKSNEFWWMDDVA